MVFLSNQVNQHFIVYFQSYFNFFQFKNSTILNHVLNQIEYLIRCFKYLYSFYITMNKNPFIQGFRQSTLTKNSQLILADVRGDGEGKLVIWSDENQKLIVYKGSNRQIQKQSKIKNANGIIQYIDEQRNPKAVIGISAQNAFFIFRSLTQSFRLRVPDIVAEPEQQILWSQFEQQPDKLTEQLKKLSIITLSQTARHFLSATTNQRKLQLIRKVFTDGITQKDSISAIAIIRQGQQQIGNIVLATQMRRLYILDSYGHSIINERVIESTPALLLAYGKYGKQYLVISIDRQGDILIYLQEDKQKPSQKIKMPSRIISASFSYPELLISTADQVISNYYFSKGSIASKKFSFKLTKQPIKVTFVTLKNNKLYFVLFQDSFRMYFQKQLVYQYFTQYKVYDLLFGSFAKEENCLILLYESHGFQVFILHRQFSVKQKYLSNRKVFSDFQNIPIPKKTTQFLQLWNQQRQKNDEANSYKLFQRSMLMLKWRTFKQKYRQKTDGGSIQLKFSSKILGLGPIFILKLQLQNHTDSPIYNLNLIWRYNRQNLSLSNVQKQIKMLPPNHPLAIQVSVKSLTFLNESIQLDTFYQDANGSSNLSRTTVHIPNCQEFAEL